MKILFTIAFLLGVLFRILSSEAHVTHVGNVLIMIGVLGGLLIQAKRLGATELRPETKSFRLGLDSDSMPHNFDERGRTPFDRVRANDR